MTPGAKIEDARDNAFCKIGRNLANFQLMESMLKVVVTNARFSSSGSNAKENFRRHEKSIGSTSFGELVERLPRVLDGQPDEPPEDHQLPWISISMSSDALPAEILRDLRREMRRIVQDRNQLVHHMLAHLDRSSLDAWNSLSVELDAQYQRTLQVFERVKLLATTVQSMRRALTENAEAIANAMLKELPPNDA